MNNYLELMMYFLSCVIDSVKKEKNLITEYAARITEQNDIFSSKIQRRASKPLRVFK